MNLDGRYDKIMEIYDVYNAYDPVLTHGVVNATGEFKIFCRHMEEGFLLVCLGLCRA